MHRPTSLLKNTEQMGATSSERFHRYNIENIDVSLSPMRTEPRHFRSGTLFDTQTFQRIQANLNARSSSSSSSAAAAAALNKSMVNEEHSSDDDTSTEIEQDLNDILHEARTTELEHLSHLIQRDRPTDTNEIVNILLELIDNVPEPTASAGANRDKPMPPTHYPLHQTGTVSDRDRPHADYGHLDRKTLAQEFQFNLETPPSSNQLQLRLNAKSFAITAWTDVPKELVMDAIKHEFGIENVQYVCIAEEISELNHQRHLHIQIILKEKVNKKKRFLDEITQTHCNYLVTRNDRAWNEYIRKDGDYIEFGDYQSVSARGQKQWPAAVASSPSSTSDHGQSTRATTTRTIHTRAQAEERRQIAKQAIDLAESSVDSAMDFIRHKMPEKFLTHSSWYLTTFKYVHLRAQRDADRRGLIEKEYVWPHSFPDCTPRLREVVNRWIRHHFSRTKRAKCLIIIGPTGIGKTSFALSLPGRVNYFKGRWNLDHWNDYARYSVYDDIPWDQFQNRNFPPKKDLLTQNGKTHATDKYRGAQQINVQQPAIVLLNPEDAGSLIATPTTVEQQQNAAYWKERAFVYIMGPDEYFYRRSKTNTNKQSGQASTSSNSSISPNQARIGELDEFERMVQRYQEKHSK